MKRTLLCVMLLISKLALANPGDGFLTRYNPVTGKFEPTTQANLGNYSLELLPQKPFVPVESMNKTLKLRNQIDRQMSQLNISKYKVEFNQSLKSIFTTSEALQNGEEVVRRIRSVCRYAVRRDIFLESPQLDRQYCGLLLNNPIEACGLDRALSQHDFDKLIADLRGKTTAETTQKELRDECEDQLRKKWEDNTQGQFVPDISSAAAVYEKLDKKTWVEDVFKEKPKYEMTTEEARIFANKCHGGNLDSCDDFPQQLLEKSLADLARLYVVAAPQMGGGFLFFRKKSCEDCFPEKFAALSTNEPENEEAQEAFKKKNSDDYKDYVEKKAQEKIIEAYSEYAKHIDRKNALKTMLGQESGSEQGDACQSGDSLVVYLGKQAKSKAGCISEDKIKERIGALNKRMFGDQADAVSSPDQFMSSLVTSIKNETFNYKNPSCRNKQTPRSGFDRVRAADFKKEYINTINEIRIDEVSKVEIAKCGEKDQRCLVAVLKEFLKRKRNLTDADAESLIQRKYLGNPYLRLLIQTKQGWTSASRLKTDDDVIKNFTDNKQHLEALAKQDAEEQCNSLLKDVATALCMKPDQAMAMVSPAKMRSEFQDRIDNISKSVSDPKEKNLQLLSVMGMACKAMDVNPEMNMDSKESAFLSDKSADVQNLADPVLRHKMIENPVGAKQEDEFYVYTDTLCDPTNSFDKKIFDDIDTTPAFQNSGFAMGSGLGGLNGLTAGSPLGHSDLPSTDLSVGGLHSSGLDPLINKGFLRSSNLSSSHGTQDPNEIVVTAQPYSLSTSLTGYYGSSMDRNCSFDISCEKAIDVGQRRTTLPSDSEVDRVAIVSDRKVPFSMSSEPIVIAPERLDAIRKDMDIRVAQMTLQPIEMKSNSQKGGGVGPSDETNGIKPGKLEQIEDNGAVAVKGDPLTESDGNSVESSNKLGGAVGGEDGSIEDGSGGGGQLVNKTISGSGGSKILSGAGGGGTGFRSIASSGGITADEGNRFNNNYNRRADYGSLESSESKQTNAELEMMKMLSQTQLQSLQMQRQVSEMRLEMERLRQSTADAMAKASEIRTTTPKAKKNAFDTPPAATSDEPVVAEEDVEEDVPAPVKPKTTKQPAGQTASNKPLSSDFAVPENFGSLAPTGSRKPSGGGSSGNSVSGGGNSGPVGGTRTVGIVTGGGLGATSSVGSVINSAGGSRSSNFAPSLTLQESITPTTTVEAIPQERKVELLKEFLGYVERNPGYQDGRYLNNANSQVVIDFQGRSLVVKVEDISDADLRAQLQERLLRQRVLLNQFVRSKRLATLQRLLAESRGGATP